MRVAINCRSFLTTHYAGIGRYAYNLVKTLSEIDQANEYWLYVRKSYFDFKRRAPRINAKNFSVKIDWLNHGLDQTLKTADLYHSPSPDFFHIHDAKVIVTVHDLVYKAHPQGHTPQTIETTDKQLHQIVERADKIICCSQNTINDLCRYFPVDLSRVALVYQGVDKKIFYPVGDHERRKAEGYIRRKGITGPFVLFVGTIEPRKNLQNLLRAFAQLKQKHKYPGKLVVIGMKGWMQEIISDVLKQLNLRNQVIFLGYVSDEALRYFYNLSDVFVFPSFYEGFGFPIVEAFCCGAAVVTSNVSSCPEIAKDAALTVNPEFPVEIAEAIHQVLQDDKLRKSLKDKGLHRAQDFSFLKTAQETLGVYEEVYKTL
ncbi:MAG: glycosyltransferase family 1 protein [Candidatus Omnitrophota bacterium]|nr:glycosyltransferase family 1 protein [Candidatus Omnitrophota bacterium]MDZ4242862.1 glycosyltransferase family 1 protein [Candidatus Omnitrophota bacterium]